jgi:hypothetical protein
MSQRWAMTLEMQVCTDFAWAEPVISWQRKGSPHRHKNLDKKLGPRQEGFCFWVGPSPVWPGCVRSSLRKVKLLKGCLNPVTPQDHPGSPTFSALEGHSMRGSAGPLPGPCLPMSKLPCLCTPASPGPMQALGAARSPGEL